VDGGGNLPFTIRSILSVVMNTPHRHRPNAALTSLEAAATLARGGFACMFSTAANMRPR
jgi:hypothetical protein